MKTSRQYRRRHLWGWLLIASITIGVLSLTRQNQNTETTFRPPRLVAYAPDHCTEIHSEAGPYKHAVVQVPGLNCLTSDFLQSHLSNFAGHTGPSPTHNLISIWTNNVVIDMRNHTLQSKGHSSGIVTIRIEEGEKPVPQNITILNGVLDLSGLGDAVRILDSWPMFDVDTPASGNSTGFKKTRIVLENLLIKTGSVGVKLEGDGNIIRDCVIESSGDGAIMMAGPNGQILNNKILLLDPLVPTQLKQQSYIDQALKLSEFRQIPRAAIVLHQATGTLISGNRIEVQGKSATRHNIYLTDTSMDVRVIGNTIVGERPAVTLMRGSTAILKNNEYVKSSSKNSFLTY